MLANFRSWPKAAQAKCTPSSGEGYISGSLKSRMQIIDVDIAERLNDKTTRILPGFRPSELLLHMLQRSTYRPARTIENDRRGVFGGLGTVMASMKWWNILRVKLREVELDRRRQWSSEDLENWLIRMEDQLQSKKIDAPIPSAGVAKTICADLIGDLARE